MLVIAILAVTTNRPSALGNLFDLWHQPLGPNRVGSLTGAVTAFVNGKQVNGDSRTIPLGAHDLIQLDVGGPVVPPQPYTFPAGLCPTPPSGRLPLCHREGVKDVTRGVMPIRVDHAPRPVRSQETSCPVWQEPWHTNLK